MSAVGILAVLTNGKVTGKVGPHIDLLADLPYLALPHDISVPSHATSDVTHVRQALCVEVRPVVHGVDDVGAGAGLDRRGDARLQVVGR